MMYLYIGRMFGWQTSRRLYYSSSLISPFKMTSSRESASRLRNLETPRPSSCPPVGRAEPTLSPFLPDPRSELYSPSLDGGPRNNPGVPFVVNIEGPIEQREARNQYHRVQSNEVDLLPLQSCSAAIPAVNGPQNEQQGWLSTLSLA